MRNLSAPLLALLNAGGPYYPVDLYVFTLVDGTIVRYAEYDLDITYSANLYSCSGPRFKRSKIRYVIGLQVDVLDLTIAYNSTLLLGTKTWAKAASDGTLDGATLTVYQVFMSSPGVVVGGYVHFYGKVANLQAGRTVIEMKVNSYLDLLNIMMPRNLYQPGCMHTLYDSGCGASRVTFSATGTVTGSASTVLSVVTNAAVTDNYSASGYITFTSGALNGIKRTVRSNVGGTFLLVAPLPSVPVAGVTLTANAGCDKQQPTCDVVFNNLVNYKSFPYIPIAETAL